MDKYRKPYAEKLLMLEEEQYSPMHFHWSKMEDIINRGGGNILIKVYNSTADGAFDNTDVKVCKDGREYCVAAGTQVRLEPGESITIYPYLYHDFTVEPGTGAVLLGEVSMCNDDENDNRFYEKLGRFPVIEEASLLTGCFAASTQRQKIELACILHLIKFTSWERMY